MKTFCILVPSLVYQKVYVTAASLEEAKEKIGRDEYDDILDSEFDRFFNEDEKPWIMISEDY